MDGGADTQGSQSAADDAAGKPEEGLCADNGLAACLRAHARKRAEGIIGQNVDSAVVRLQVVNVLAKDEGPEVFAEELDDVEGVVEARAVAGESFYEALPDAVALRLEPVVHRIEVLVVVYPLCGMLDRRGGGLRLRLRGGAVVVGMLLLLVVRWRGELRGQR